MGLGYDAGDYWPRSIGIGDFDEDGHQDLAVTNVGSHDVTILFGTGNGRFQVGPFYGVGDEPQSVAVGDFNEDGHQDLAVANDYFSANVAILTGNGDGSFQDAAFYGTEKGTHCVAVGDFDEDNHQDLAVASRHDYVTVLLNGRKEIEVEVDCPVEKIPRGVGLPIDVMITNRTDSTIVFDITTWVKPVGGEKILLNGPRSFSLGGGKNKGFRASITIPGNLLLGDYILTLEATALTEEILDEDSFRVRVVRSGGGKVTVSAH